MRLAAFTAAIAVAVMASAPVRAGRPPQRAPSAELAPIITAKSSLDGLVDDAPIAPTTISRLPEAPVPIAPRFVCRGTEPFWTLTIEHSHLLFTLAGEEPVRYSAPAANSSENSTPSVTNFTGVAIPPAPVSVAPRAGDPTSALRQPPSSTPGAMPGETAAAASSAQSMPGHTLNALVVDARLNDGVRCNDGMSDQQYDYTVFINKGGLIYDGCCWIER